MNSLRWGRIITVSILLVVLGVGLFVFFVKNKKTPLPTPKDIGLISQSIIGTSVEGRKIEAYRFGQGNKHLVFVGGIHGGYEWNSVLLAYNLIDYLTVNPTLIPTSLTITIIPSANPDGLFLVTGRDSRFILADIKSNLLNGTGRFNANQVDLNRNFACNWQATSTWKGKIVSAGTAPFSEPEAKAIRDFILTDKPVAVIFFHSQANAVYASQCNNGILSGTLNLLNTYSRAADYPAVKVFTAYATTGAAEDWLASINVPAITVELQTHETVEWERNLAGIKALFDYYRQN